MKVHPGCTHYHGGVCGYVQDRRTERNTATPLIATTAPEIASSRSAYLIIFVVHRIVGCAEGPHARQVGQTRNKTDPSTQHVKKTDAKTSAGLAILISMTS